MLDRFEVFTTKIASIYRSIQRIKKLEMTEFGLKGTHVMCLYNLYTSGGGMTAAQLSAACDEDKAAVSRSVAELTEKGFVVVYPAQGKKYKSKIVLTSSGSEIAEKIKEIIKSAVIKGGSGLTDELRAAFYTALNTISDNLIKFLDEKTMTIS